MRGGRERREGRKEGWKEGELSYVHAFVDDCIVLYSFPCFPRLGVGSVDEGCLSEKSTVWT